MNNVWNDHYLSITKDSRHKLRAVCCSDFSLFSNRLVDFVQNRAFVRLFRNLDFAPNIGALDIGCGGGRWVNRMIGRGINSYGIDISIAALNRIPLLDRKRFSVGSATMLPFKASSFTIVSNVTVIHHVTYDMQDMIGKEIARILSNGGYWLLLEHLTPNGKSAKDVSWPGVYPRSFEEWKQFLISNGMDIIAANRFHYMPVTRSILNLFEAIEKKYVKYKKGKSARQNSHAKSFPSQGNSVKTQASCRPSKRHKIYAQLKSVLLNIPMVVDIFIGLLGERNRGSHIAILARKASAVQHAA